MNFCAIQKREHNHNDVNERKANQLPTKMVQQKNRKKIDETYRLHGMERKKRYTTDKSLFQLDSYASSFGCCTVAYPNDIVQSCANCLSLFNPTTSTRSINKNSFCSGCCSANTHISSFYIFAVNMYIFFQLCSTRFLYIFISAQHI